MAASWLQSHPTTFSCDGKWHTQNFQIDKSELVPEDFEDPNSPLVPVGYGEPIPGSAWVQFCLINEGEGIFLIDQGWKKVR
ncbi:MAG: hypothetical protein M3401_18485 [Actinomycetota bacterium]|nr:hypothetical protein [Actinomycetota bacterium]